MAALALLERHPDPSEAEIVESMDSVYCRCTGYDKIVRAVMETAKDMREAVR
jgi:carbon-monoxide dehydrogenase small subunit